MQSSSSALAQAAYGSVNTNIRTERSVEYQAFARATSLLSKAQTAPSDMPLLAEALDFNRRLWNVLSSDVSQDANQLPDALRAQIVSIAIFVRKHSAGALQQSQKIDPLIEINTSIMRGLSEQ